jgi:hypothetical protein
MGIFDLRGVEPVSLAHNSLRAESVNPHPDRRLSPNNAQFKVMPDRSVVSFWSVAQYKDHAAITFNIIITHPGLFNALAGLLKNAITAQDLLNRLKDISAMTTDDDLRTLNNAHAMIIKLLTASAPKRPSGK